MKVSVVVALFVMVGSMTSVSAKDELPYQQTVIDQNSLAATPAYSGDWFKHITIGGAGSVVGIAGNHTPAGTFKMLDSSSDLYVNNFNLLVGVDLASWSKATLNLAYLGAPIPWNNLKLLANNDADKRSLPFRRVMHTVVADELYLTIADPKKSPFYFTVGKKYVPFGTYTDPYVPYQIMSPAQMLAQTNAATAIVGMTTNLGFYANVFAFRGVTFPEDSQSMSLRNFGGKIGYYRENLGIIHTSDTRVHFNLSYIRNLWDSQNFNPNPDPNLSWDEAGKDKDDTCKEGHPSCWTEKSGNDIDPVAGLSAHVDLAYNSFSISANWVSALRNMANATNESSIDPTGLVAYSRKADSSKFWAADVESRYAFKTFGHDSSLGIGVQWTGNGDWFSDNESVVTDWSAIIPKCRLVGEYKANLFKHVDLGLAVARSRSYDFVDKGNSYKSTGSRRATVALARLSVKL